MKIVIGLVSVAIVALVATVIFLVPLVEVPYYETVIKYETVTVLRTEQYEAQVENPLSYRVINSSANSEISLSLGVYVECFVSIENTDTVPGTFVVDFTVTTLNRTFTDNDRAYILPGEVKTLTGIADIDMGEDWNWYPSITPGTKTVTEIRYRSVSYQEEVPYPEEVLHQKKVTLFEYMTEY